MSDFQTEFNGKPVFPTTLEPEETAEEFANRIGLEVKGEISRKYAALKGRGMSDKNMVLAEQGVAIDANGDLRDAETGDLVPESIYAE